MFGPNVSSKINITTNFHHREDAFEVVYSDIIRIFRAKFDIPSDYDILIITGSGTLSVEAFISSFRGNLRVESPDITNDKFAGRWRDMINHYGKYDERSLNSIRVMYETSLSRYNGDAEATFVDAISGFPFWPAPRALAWSTVSSKLLGAAPVLGILVIQRDFMRDYIDNSPSYLNPWKYLEFQRTNQTPFTPAIPLFQDLRDRLLNFDVSELRRRIETNFNILLTSLEDQEIINRDITPVMTLPKDIIPPEVIHKWSLYSHKGGPYVQIFMYSETIDQYEMLAADIKKTRKKGGHYRSRHDGSEPLTSSEKSLY
jgi:hypothetical protein